MTNQNHIYAKILADSVSSTDGQRITSFEINIPKVFLAEFNTHRAISRNFSSSRAIPTAAFTKIDTYEPLYYGENQPGMMAKKTEIKSPNKEIAEYVWNSAVETCKQTATILNSLGLHKQWANRPLDWATYARGVITFTDISNFLFLRDDEEAQPEFADLAAKMRIASAESKPEILEPGQWHLPYISYTFVDGEQRYFDSDDSELTLEEAKRISASSCAQVSYRKLDTSKAKALEIYEKLFSGRKPHMSPVEHQATPMSADNIMFSPETWEPGITHVTKSGKLCSGNFSGWIQHRQLLPNNVT